MLAGLTISLSQDVEQLLNRTRRVANDPSLTWYHGNYGPHVVDGVGKETRKELVWTGCHGVGHGRWTTCSGGGQEYEGGTSKDSDSIRQVA